MRREQNRIKRQGLLLPTLSGTLCIIVLLLTGCAVKLPTGRIEFHPSPTIREQDAKTVIGKIGNKTDTDLSAKGRYSRKGEELKFENENVTVVLKEARKGDKEREGDTLFKRLFERDFVLLQMSITNRSNNKKIRYDPAITALLDSDLGYSKPLDYPMLYEMAMKERTLEKGLTRFRSSFYDLGITVLPLQNLSRYIIFSPISKGAKRAKLVIKNLYIGTEVIDLTFPFVLTGADNSKK